MKLDMILSLNYICNQKYLNNNKDKIDKRFKKMRSMDTTTESKLWQNEKLKIGNFLIH